METSDGATGNTAQTQTEGSTEAGQEQTSAKTESAAPEVCEEAASDLKTAVSHLPEGSPVVGPSADGPGGVALKVATTVLHPVCLGDSPLMLPIHLQMNGGAPLGQVGAAPYLITSQSPVSLPLVLEQLQHMGPSVLPQSPGCAPLPLQSSVLCQGGLPFALSPGAEQKTVGQTPDTNLLSLLQNPAFAAILQDLFPSQNGTSGCQPSGSPFFSAPAPPPYTSPLAPLVPPATLLVPYPVIMPLPVPLPVPLPIPVPVPSEDSKGNLPKSVCTVSKSTQTSLQDTTSAPPPSGAHPPHTVTMSSTPEEGQVLDLSVRTCPIQPKQEFPSAPQQDNVLDLSVPGARGKVSQDSGGAALSVGMECSQSLDSKLLGSLASVEFSRQHKWVVDSTPGSSALGQDASLSGTGNLEIVSASQTAKVIVSVKDAIPAILCGKIKGLSGVSTKNFSIKRDAAQGTSLQQLYGVQPVPQGEQRDPNDPLKKTPKNRAIKLKKVSSQEIHFLPIKKQRLAALLPRK